MAVPSVSIVIANSVMPEPIRVGEGPHWNGRTGRLHWVDILAGSLHTSDLVTGSTSSISVPTLIGAAVPRRRGGFVAATSDGFATVDRDGSYETRLAIMPGDSRMNDAKCDRLGRFWAGSTELEFEPGRGLLHVLFPDWTTRVVWEGLTLPNGLGWSADGLTFYLVDTIEGEVCAFDADPATAQLSGRRVLRRFPVEGGMPDGLTVDTAGCLWIAMWGGGRVMRISPNGDLLAQIALPVHQPSSCTFGGGSLDTLYVTSAREGLTLDAASDDGSVFSVRDVGAVGTRSEVFAG